MKAYLTKRYRFSASHRLHTGEMSEAENRDTYGKCNNPHGHGHNYSLYVTVGGDVDAATGMVCNLTDLDRAVCEKVLERMGDSNLNTLSEFQSRVPTTENLCISIYRALQNDFHPARLEKVRIEETMLNSFEYSGETSNGPGRRG